MFQAVLNAIHRGVTVRILTNNYTTVTSEGMITPLDFLAVAGAEVRTFTTVRVLLTRTQCAGAHRACACARIVADENQGHIHPREVHDGRQQPRCDLQRELGLHVVHGESRSRCDHRRQRRSARDEFPSIGVRLRFQSRNSMVDSTILIERSLGHQQQENRPCCYSAAASLLGRVRH